MLSSRACGIAQSPAREEGRKARGQRFQEPNRTRFLHSSPNGARAPGKQLSSSQMETEQPLRQQKRLRSQQRRQHGIAKQNLFNFLKKKEREEQATERKKNRKQTECQRHDNPI